MQTRIIRLIQDTLKENLVVHPDKIALICEGQRLTYAQIDEKANRLANAFYNNGVQRGDRLIFYLLNGVELVIGVFAALKASAVFSVVDYAMQPDKLRYILSDCQAVALVTHDLQAELARRCLRDIPSLRLAILTGPGATEQLQTDPGLLAFDGIQHDYVPILPQSETIDHDLAYLLYTSGSTGESKGVMTTHQSSLFAIEIAIEYLGLTSDDIITSPLPLSYSHGFNQLLKSFRAGSTLILEKSFAYPAVTLRRMEIEHATGFAGVPTVYAILLQMDLSRYDLHHLRFLSSAGAPLAPNLIQQIRQKIPQASLFSIYGMAEASNALGLDPTQTDLRPSSVGKPFPGTEVWLVDDNDRRLGPNQIGELVVRGGHVRCGYWNDPATSSGRFRAGPIPGELVCYSGDLFRMDVDGYFYFVGRNDEVIKSSGKKISPREIENALYGFSGILEAAAIGVPDPMVGQVIKAFVVLDRHRQPAPTIQEILDHCRQRLEEWMVPRQIEIMDSLPKTASGKIKKNELVQG